MKEINLKCPAKINLNLKITGKRADGFHNIQSIMQTINLFDLINIKVLNYSSNEIVISGNCRDIPYDKSNLAFKAAQLFLDSNNIKNKKIEIFIDKNIPVAAGLAGGSTDAAGVLYGLNKIFDTNSNINSMCAKLGSDLNVCLNGGRILAQGRGEIIQPLPFENFTLSLIKPLNLGISAKEAYSKFANKTENSDKNNFVNDLEWAVFDDYKELQYIKQKYPQSVMTGSGSTYFMINDEFEQEENFWVKNNLAAVNYGVTGF